MSLVLVSHSHKLALAVRDLARQMAGPDLTIAVASGIGARHLELGTDAVHIAKVLRKVCGADGALVLMDIGSSVLSAKTALELVEPTLREKIRLSSGPLAEGVLAAAVQAAANCSLDDVFQEAQRALAGKEQQLGGDPLPLRPTSKSPDDADEIVIAIRNEHGLHARPAANLIRALGKYRADVQISNQTSGRGPVPARSMTSMALLQIKKGDQVRVTATGADRVAALAEISELAAKDFNDVAVVIESIPAPVVARGQGGIPASDGIAIGPLACLRDLPISIPETLADNPAVEVEKLMSAIARVRSAFAGESPAGHDGNEIMEAQALILDDPVLIEKLKKLVEKNRWNRARAWMIANTELSELYEKMNDPYLRARAADIRDIGQRVLQELVGESPSAIRLERPSILFVDELLASDATACDPAMVLGVITRQGSPTAHSSILLGTRGIPMIVGVDWLDEKTIEGVTVAMDGGTGEIWLNPSSEIVSKLTAKKNDQRAQQQESARNRTLPSVTLDDVRIEVLANVGNVNDAAEAAQNGAEGIGLLRSELLFLSRTQVPSEREGEQALREIFAAIQGTIIVRTLDVGADKPLAFQPQQYERNPFLGVRGIRLSLRHPEFFLPHLRAILSAAAGRDVWLMLPMISVVEEIQQTRSLLERAHEELESEGRDHLWPVKLGVMIEVPSAALMAEQLAAEAEFFSIGTNDLTQYVMAAERGNGALGALQDALQPAVLRLMKKVANSAAITARHVSICGDAASDPIAAAVFAGLGIHSLSVRPRQAAAIKALFRQLKYSDLTALAHGALQCVDAGHVRSIFRECLANHALPTM